MSADGAMVPLTGGEWAEVRTLAIGEVPAGSVYPERVHVGELSYFSRLTDAASFTDLAEVETRRRQLVHAKEVCAMMDGADGLQPFVEMHRSDAVRILDFPHAAEHLSKLLEALSARGHPFPAGMLERGVPVLKHPGPAALTRMAARLSEQETSQEDVREHLGYLRKRLALMNYPLFQRAGWPIGSGMGESANKLVVEARLKGCGMRWERPNVKPCSPCAMASGMSAGRKPGTLPASSVEWFEPNTDTIGCPTATSPARGSQVGSHCSSLPCASPCASFASRAPGQDCWHFTPFSPSSLEAWSVLCPQPVRKKVRRTLSLIPSRLPERFMLNCVHIDKEANRKSTPKDPVSHREEKPCKPV